MSEKDIKNLIELAKQKLQKGVSKEEALQAFVAAGIMNESGKFTKPYQHLASAIEA